MTNMMTASIQWAKRPDDQRYLSLEELRAAVATRRDHSWTAGVPANRLSALPTASGGVGLRVYDPTAGEDRVLDASHWSFGQLAGYANAPAGYLRALPAELAAINLQWGIEHNPMRDSVLVLGATNGESQLRSLTSESYGRIWDHEVVDAVVKANGDGRWQVPAASYATTNPKRATTLYASDRDVFLFLVDPNNPIEIGKETLFRGFFAWNSEVGAATFGLCTFLYRYVCDNRIIWGATEVNELRIRHTKGAPDRFAYEGEQYLQRYATESVDRIVAGVKRAQATEIPVAKDQSVAQWLQARGFTKGTAQGAYESAVAEEGQARSAWDIVQGITAYARTLQNADSRVALETQAGKIMEEVTA